jgi:hypothetical protein
MPSRNLAHQGRTPGALDGSLGVHDIAKSQGLPSPGRRVGSGFKAFTRLEARRAHDNLLV